MTHTSSTEATEAGAGRPLDIEAGRRAFMKAAGITGALAAFGTAMGATEARAQSSDVDTAILNFALNLEYLEGEYYNRGVYGQGLPANLTSGKGFSGGGVRGGSKVNFQNVVVLDTMAEVANDEKNHIGFLRSTLGSAAAAEPIISLDTAFTAFAAAAGLPGNFSPYSDDYNFLLGAYILTEVGVTAYNGAAPFITSKTILAAASSIFAAEAYHLGTIRSLLYAQQNAGYTNATALISAARAQLSGTVDDEGIGADQSTLAGGFPSPANITDTDANSLAWARTPRQVLNVVTGKAGSNSGGFFPNGLSNPGGELGRLLAATGG
ncbi:ferritin-like domain-containing protein [Lichenibacterium dinghuense]|uniref:ferritin-like domain-containing protein n=1 Tax=Lichenibacterium dinghuense TaxID=2895977 RepID=UPI001F35D065|nr:ferritin-like domain-containing protein [Lichenibacterium sp. 6Y81]